MLALIYIIYIIYIYIQSKAQSDTRGDTKQAERIS